jgi:SAM-dependent MidA family methyltransferase
MTEAQAHCCDVNVQLDPLRIARLFPSFRDFVDDALFHPAWGYYSTGKVRFGEGGHYDTFPLALSPLFGRMLARYAYRFWRLAGRPVPFEICELGAGNGQLCLDTVLSVRAASTGAGGWREFARALRYRIVERSPALIARQQAILGPVADGVMWTHADLAQSDAPRRRFARCGLVFANEVLDCLAHHKIMPQAGNTPGVVFVIPVLDAATAALGGLPVMPGVFPGVAAVPRDALASVMCDARLRPDATFREVVLPLQAVPGLTEFVWGYYPELFAARRKFRPCFVCPAIPRMIRNVARLYDQSEALWIDYGETREFHLGTPASQRVFAGPPRSGATVYRAPGLDDITFLVDFSVLWTAARGAGSRVVFFGGQGELARRSGVRFDAHAVESIVQHHALDWMLAVIGIGPERSWRHTGLTWTKDGGTGVRIRTDAKRAVAEFLGRRKSNFKLMLLRSVRQRPQKRNRAPCL